MEIAIIHCKCEVKATDFLGHDKKYSCNTNLMIACKGDDEMRRPCDGNRFRFEQPQAGAKLQPTTFSHRKAVESNVSGSCRDCLHIPYTGSSKQATCPEHVCDCSSLDQASLTVSPLRAFLLHLFTEKGIKDPQRDVRLIIDSSMIATYKAKGTTPACQSDETTAETCQLDTYPTKTKSTPRLVGWSGMNETLESSVEDNITSFISVFSVDSSSDQDSSYRSIDMLVKDEVYPRPYESPTSIADMLGMDDITMEKNSQHPFLLPVKPPHSSMSSLSGNG